MVEFDTDKCRTELKMCLNKKINKTTIMWGIGIYCTITFFATLGVIAAYSRGVIERQVNTDYMITSKCERVSEKLNEYCTKDKFHVVDKKLDGVERDVGYIKNDMKELKKISDKVWEAIQRMEHKSNSPGVSREQ